MPGSLEYIEKNPDIKKWIADQELNVYKAIAELHEPRFDEALHMYVEGWSRVNELVAEDYVRSIREKPDWEDYREASPLPEVRHPDFNWLYLLPLKRFHSLVLETRWGDVTVFRKKPSLDPGVERWLSVEEVIDMVDHPAMASVLEAFDTFPVRPGKRDKPGKGENHMMLMVTNEGAHWKARYGG